MANKKIADDLDPSLIAAILRNRSCAELETVVNEAATIAAYNGCEVVAAEHMVEASMRAVFHIPAECLYDTDPVNLNTDSEKSLVVWHEAGHTLMNELLKPGSVALVSAKSKQSSHSGFTVTSLHEVHNGYRKIIYDILIDLGGKAAVDVVFGLPETGVRDDMSTATESLFKLISTVNSHGFYLHRHYYDPWDGDSFLDSDATAHDRQVAAAILLEDYYGKVKRTLIANRMLLWKIAHALAEKSYLTAKDLAELMKGETLVKPEL